MLTGRTELLPLQASAISALAAITVVCDLKWGRIFNWITIPALALGLVADLFLEGHKGLFSGFLGALAGLLLYGWLFRIRVLGGGDVKLLMALGAWGGPVFAVNVAFLAVLLGGVIAAAILLWKKKLGSFSQRLYRTILSVTVKELEPEAMKIDYSMKMPFGIPMGIAASWIAWGGPLWNF